MKTYKLTRNLLVGAVLSLAVGTAFAGISATKHNLGTGSGDNAFDATGEICVFCHTPHGADVSANPPLWNRVLPDPTTFTTYDSLGTSTLDGEVLNVGSVSIACLSCHDGTQAMNVMINAPGPGGYDPAGFTLAGTWTGLTAGATPVGSLNYATASIVNLGKDLTNDHPIGVEYGGGGCGAVAGVTCSPAAGNTADPDFRDARRTADTVDQWFVDVDGDTIRDKTDMILYTRAFTTPGPGVECGSCHDPHNEAGLFLRLDNTDSAVCLACHIK
jgi:predicted CXXCH cytochrome family protein